MKTTLIATVAAMALLTACGGKDEGVDLPGSDITFGEVELPEVNLRGGDAGEAPAALAALSLDSADAGRISFASSSQDGADATFNDVVITIEEGEAPIRAGSLVLKGLEMTDAGANFAQMTFSDLTVTPDDEDLSLIHI